MNLEHLKADLERDEGHVDHPYLDRKGYWTCGVGFLIDARRGGKIPEAVVKFWTERAGGVAFPMPESVIQFWLGYEIQKRYRYLLDHHNSFQKQNDARQNALIGMAFNVGLSGIDKFVKMWNALESGNTDAAADEIADSNAARELGERYGRYEETMRTGQ